MKKLVFLFILAFTVNSCYTHDDYINSEYRTLPVESVIMPAEFHVNQINDITVQYRRPSNCYYFNGFYYDKIDNIRVVAINAIKEYHHNCENASEILYDVPLHFEPTKTGHFIFKFYSGIDVDGEDEFLTYEIDVLP